MYLDSGLLDMCLCVRARNCVCMSVLRVYSFVRERRLSNYFLSVYFFACTYIVRVRTLIVRVCVRVRMPLCTLVCACMCLCAGVLVWVAVCVCACVYGCLWVFVYVCECV